MSFIGIHRLAAQSFWSVLASALREFLSVIVLGQLQRRELTAAAVWGMGGTGLREVGSVQGNASPFSITLRGFGDSLPTAKKRNESPQQTSHESGSRRKKVFSP